MKIKKLMKTMVFPIAFIINTLLEKNKTYVIFRLGKAIGDQLCITAVIEALYKQYNFKVIVITNYPEIFYNNSYVYKIIDVNKYPDFVKKIINITLFGLRGKNIEYFGFTREGIKFEDYMRNTKLKMSLIECHSMHFKYPLKLKNAKPRIYFSNEEIYKYSKKFKEILEKDYAVISPISKKSYTPNKDWGFEKFQKVVNTINEITWVQVGLKTEPLLNNVIDLRGKTTLRELFFIVSKAKFVLCNEGLLNHIAAAVGTKSFVIFSGFSPVEIANYDTTIPIVKNPQEKCAPCWKLTKCKHGKKCLESIKPEYVVEIIRNEALLKK